MSAYLFKGDGLFESITIINGKAPLWQRHMMRLRKDCERLAIPFPDTELIHNEAQGLYQAV